MDRENFYERVAYRAMTTTKDSADGVIQAVNKGCVESGVLGVVALHCARRASQMEDIPAPVQGLMAVQYAIIAGVAIGIETCREEMEEAALRRMAGAEVEK